MRKQLRKFLPGHEAIRSSRWLAPFGDTLRHPRLWHLNRRSAAGAVAVGLFCGLVPGPLQMPGAAVLSVIFRVNLPLALVTTFYTNPLTIVPLYLAAYRIGRSVVGDSGEFVAPPRFEWPEFGAWIDASVDWMMGLGEPLAIGLPLLAGLLALLGYVAVRTAWRLYLIQAWRRRQRRRGK
jgi:uncharacterized protein